MVHQDSSETPEVEPWGHAKKEKTIVRAEQVDSEVDPWGHAKNEKTIVLAEEVDTVDVEPSRHLEDESTTTQAAQE